jgi:hypothetical protein
MATFAQDARSDGWSGSFHYEEEMTLVGAYGRARAIREPER